MRSRSYTLLTVIAYGALVLPWADARDKSSTDAGKTANKDSTAGVFGLTKVHEYHIELAAWEWDRMQPKGGGGPFGFGPGGPGGPGFPGGPPGDKPADEVGQSHRSMFGMEFPWARAALTEDGKTYKDLGIRFKGNASYMASARGLRRNLKIELDRHNDAQRYRGLKTLNLNAGAADPTRGREALAFAIYRAAGVPAPRTAFAKVTLSVLDKYDRELLGLYTVVEQVDRTFLKDRFGDGKGLLLKPERTRSVEYLGEDWDRYKGQYRPKHEPTKKEARRVIDFARLIHKGSEDDFKNDIASYLDMDEYLRFLAATAFVANLDSMFMLGHNYYVYLNPKTNKFVFIPWDLDLSLGGFPMSGTPEQQVELSLTHPYSGQHKLTERLLGAPEIKDRYKKLLAELASGPFSRERLLADVDAIEKTTSDVLAQEKKAATTRKESAGGFGFGPPGGMFGKALSLREFVDKRTDAVAAQIAGKSKGYEPAGFGGPGGGFGPGNFWARPLLMVLDSDKDGTLSRAELVAGARRFFKDSDKDKKGWIDEKAIAEGLNRIFPRPPGFGPPPGGPPPATPGDKPRAGEAPLPKPPADRPAPDRAAERPPRDGPPRGGPGFGPPGGPGRFPFGGGMGAMLAPAIVKRADADKDGKVTVEELVQAAEALFKECDKDKTGTLDEKEIAAGIGLLFPQPPRFGPLGPPPGPRPQPPAEGPRP